MTRRATLAVVLLAGLTVAHFDLGLADGWPRLAGLPGGLVWHGAFCLVAAGVFRVLAGRAGSRDGP